MMIPLRGHRDDPDFWRIRDTIRGSVTGFRIMVDDSWSFGGVVLERMTQNCYFVRIVVRTSLSEISWLHRFLSENCRRVNVEEKSIGPAMMISNLTADEAIEVALLFVPFLKSDMATMRVYDKATYEKWADGMFRL
jgi:hypothetical protein